jgi:small-conductance mechanosensitive channel
MKVRQRMTGVVLLLLIGAAIAGLVWTRDSGPDTAASSGADARPQSKAFLKKVASAQQNPLVDQRPLLTARRMAALATTADEQPLAHEALRLGDHEVDLTFADTLRRATDNPVTLTPELQELATRKSTAQTAVKAQQEQITGLTRQLAHAAEAQKDNLQDQLDVAQAQLELDQDELDDASDDLERAGGDPQAKIEQLKAEHEAGDHEAQPAGAGTTAAPVDDAANLLALLRAWDGWRGKHGQLNQALQETQEKIQYLVERHGKFAKVVAQEKETRESTRQQAAGFSKGGKANHDESRAAAQAALDSLKHFTDAQKNLADHGKRIQDEQELGDVYTNWIALVETHERTAQHRILQSVLWILAILLLVYLLERAIDHFLVEAATEDKHLSTLRMVLKLAGRAVGAIVLLLIVFGMPSQMATILGFVGAGLTVALKDFIVPFFGWFVLMGRNGIHVGDWVEIEGVGGEVIEIGLLRTVLMETGNWTDSGHPTGRKVAFPNSFAIEGHYFNLSTSGQWMWDELQLTIPGDEDPYPAIDKLQKVVAKESQENAKKAEAEWQKATTRYRVQAFSAEPAVNVRPTGSGVEVRVRYITRAYERHETRKKMNDAVIEMMHGKHEDGKVVG